MFGFVVTKTSETMQVIAQGSHKDFFNMAKSDMLRFSICLIYSFRGILQGESIERHSDEYPSTTVFPRVNSCIAINQYQTQPKKNTLIVGFIPDAAPFTYLSTTRAFAGLRLN